MTSPSIRCPDCGLVSHHPQDVVHRFCPTCGFHDQIPWILLSRLFDDTHEWLAFMVAPHPELGRRKPIDMINEDDADLTELIALLRKMGEDAGIVVRKLGGTGPR